MRTVNLPDSIDTSGKVGFVLEDGHIKHAPEAKDVALGDLLDMGKE